MTQRPPTFDHLKKKRPYELRDLILVGDEAASEAYDDAKRQVQNAELIGNDDTRLKEARANLETAEVALKAQCIEVVFRAMKPKEFEKLTRSHPPSEEVGKEQKEKYGSVLDYDPELLAPYLIAASCVQPVMTVEDVQSLITEHGWNAAEYGHLFQLALDVNTRRRVVNWGN